MNYLKNVVGVCLVALVIFSCKTKTVVIEAQEVGDIVSYLASDELEGRDTGSEGIEKAAVYIENYFKELDIQPYFDSYRDSFTVKEKSAFNIIGYLEGTDPALKDEFVIIGAHYDHIGFGKEVEGDKIANGANDNAAGVGTVLTMAKYFAKTKSNKRLIIIAYFRRIIKIFRLVLIIIFNGVVE